MVLNVDMSRCNLLFLELLREYDVAMSRAALDEPTLPNLGAGERFLALLLPLARIGDDRTILPLRGVLVVLRVSICASTYA